MMRVQVKISSFREKAQFYSMLSMHIRYILENSQKNMQKKKHLNSEVL